MTTNEDTVGSTPVVGTVEPPTLRLPPDDYKEMNTFKLACDFIADMMTCSDEVVNELKARLNITGRKLTVLGPKTAHLAGIEDPSFVSVLTADTAATLGAVTLLVSPPETGYWSTHPFWHTYDISASDGGAEPRIGIPWG